jgi:hypothetical protein
MLGKTLHKVHYFSFAMGEYSINKMIDFMSPHHTEWVTSYSRDHSMESGEDIKFLSDGPVHNTVNMTTKFTCT